MELRSGMVLRHHSGRVYTVTSIAIIARHKIVNYMGADGQRFCRPLREFDGKFTVLFDGNNLSEEDHVYVCQKRQTWLPIETAPKDGTEILICQAYNADGQIITDNFGLFVHRANWWPDENEGRGSWVTYNNRAFEREVFFEPTHWMPIPKFDGGT